MIEPGNINLGDCLELMPDIQDKSIDMILCDLPYGTTACKWDVIIPFEPLWKQYKRIIKDNGAIVLTGREPFTSMLVVSNIKNYKHKWVWNKKQSGSFCTAKYMPLQIEEDIIVFSYGAVKYYPRMRKGIFRVKGGGRNSELYKSLSTGYCVENDEYYPVNIIDFPNCCNKEDNIHPTQKPVDLFAYLINTYTKPGELVLDNCCGSGTTAIAATRTGRDWICMEKDPEIFQAAQKRIEAEQSQLRLAL